MPTGPIVKKENAPKQRHAPRPPVAPREGAPASRASSVTIPEWALVAATSVALFIFFFLFTLDRPYHLDTTAYFDSVRDLTSGRVTCGYGTRCMVSYYMIPFAVLGAAAVKVGFVAAAVLFFLFSYLFFRRVFTLHTAYVASLLPLFIPAGLITTTHLKEDFVGLLFLALSLWLATRGPVLSTLLSPVAFSFSLLSKEAALLFTPFWLCVVAFYLFECDRAPIARTVRDWKKWLLLAATLGVVAAVTLSIKRDYIDGLASLTDSPYLGQFKGPFSELLPGGFEQFQRGMGLGLLFWFQLLGIVLLVVEKDRRKQVLWVLFAVNAVIIALFSMNNTVMTYRNFVIVAFLTLPLAVEGLARLTAPKWVYLAGAVTVVVLVSRSYAYIDFHARYNSQEKFFAGLKNALDPNAVLVTMDYAGLARHYLGRETRQHVPDPDERQAQAFVDAIKQDSVHTYYLLPDAFSYDSNNTLRSRMQAAFTIEQVYDGWFEDYHSMDYGYTPGELRSKLAQQTGCSITQSIQETTTVETMQLDQYRYQLRCADGLKTATYPGYKGKVSASLMKVQVLRLVPNR